MYYFTGDMCKVDWQKTTLSTESPLVVATPSLDTLSIRGLPRSTRPDWRGRVQGEEHAPFGRSAAPPGPKSNGTPIGSPDIRVQLVHVATESEKKERN